MEITERMKQLGCNEFFYNQIKDMQLDKEEFQVARVTAVHKENYKIAAESGEKWAKLKGGIFYNEQVAAEYPVAGDFVIVMHNPYGEDTIIKTLNRKSKLSRLDSFNEKEQVLVANFDHILIMMSLNQDFNLKKLERYLTISWESGGVPVVVLTKADLCDDYEDKVSAVKGIAFGVEVVVISSYTGFGLLDLDKYLTPEKTIVLLGSSGVGKSSFVNAVTEEVLMKTSEIREDDAKGKHTTTHRQLIFLTSGAILIDTPGIREVGMWNSKEGFDTVFSDVSELINSCRFTNCTHRNEPGCRILEALDTGEMTKERWNNYLKLQKEIQYAKKKQELSEMKLRNKRKR